MTLQGTAFATSFLLWKVACRNLRCHLRCHLTAPSGDRFRPEMPCQWLWWPLVTLEQWPSVTFTPSNCHGKMATMANMDKHGWLSQKMAGNDLWQLGRFFRDGHTHDPTKFMEPEYICSPLWLSHPWPIAAPFNLSRCGGLREADSSVGEADDFTQDREDGKGNAHIQGNSNHARPGARVEKHGSWDMARSRTAGAGHRLYYQTLGGNGDRWSLAHRTRQWAQPINWMCTHQVGNHGLPSFPMSHPWQLQTCGGPHRLDWDVVNSWHFSQWILMLWPNKCNTPKKTVNRWHATRACVLEMLVGLRIEECRSTPSNHLTKPVSS